MATRTKRAERLAKAHEAKAPKKRLNTHKAKLSEAHRAVVDAYFANGCVSYKRALLACGYAATTATNASQCVFGRDDVRAEIERRHRLHEKRAVVTEERIMAEFAKLAFANVGDLLEVNEDGSAYIDFNLLTRDQKAALAEFQVETYQERSEDGESSTMVKKSRVKFASKQAALDSLARIKGMFKDKLEVSNAASLVDRIQKARERLQPGKASAE